MNFNEGLSKTENFVNQFVTELTTSQSDARRIEREQEQGEKTDHGKLGETMSDSRDIADSALKRCKKTEGGLIKTALDAVKKENSVTGGLLSNRNFTKALDDTVKLFETEENKENTDSEEDGSLFDMIGERVSNLTDLVSRSESPLGYGPEEESSDTAMGKLGKSLVTFATDVQIKASARSQGGEGEQSRTSIPGANLPLDVASKFITPENARTVSKMLQGGQAALFGGANNQKEDADKSSTTNSDSLGKTGLSGFLKAPLSNAAGMLAVEDQDMQKIKGLESFASSQMATLTMSGLGGFASKSNAGEAMEFFGFEETGKFLQNGNPSLNQLEDALMQGDLDSPLLGAMGLDAPMLNGIRGGANMLGFGPGDDASLVDTLTDPRGFINDTFAGEDSAKLSLDMESLKKTGLDLASVGSDLGLIDREQTLNTINKAKSKLNMIDFAKYQNVRKLTSDALTDLRGVVTASKGGKLKSLLSETAAEQALRMSGFEGCAVLDQGLQNIAGNIFSAVGGDTAVWSAQVRMEQLLNNPGDQEKENLKQKDGVLSKIFGFLSDAQEFATSELDKVQEAIKPQPVEGEPKDEENIFFKLQKDLEGMVREDALMNKSPDEIMTEAKNRFKEAKEKSKSLKDIWTEAVDQTMEDSENELEALTSTCETCCDKNKCPLEPQGKLRGVFDSLRTKALAPDTGKAFLEEQKKTLKTKWGDYV